jgi:hypothetical protein
VPKVEDVQIQVSFFCNNDRSNLIILLLKYYSF